MKRGILKKIIALTFIITLLQNYILFVSNSAIVIATEGSEWVSREMTNLESISNTESSNDEEELNIEEGDLSTDLESSESLNSPDIIPGAEAEVSEEIEPVEEIVQPDESADESNIQDTILEDTPVEEIENALSIDISADRVLHYMNSTVEGIIVESKLNISSNSDAVYSAGLLLNAPKISDKAPYNVIINNKYEDIKSSYENGQLSIEIPSFLEYVSSQDLNTPSSEESSENSFGFESRSKIKVDSFDNEGINLAEELDKSEPIITRRNVEISLILFYEISEFENLKMSLNGMSTIGVQNGSFEQEVFAEKELENIIQSNSELEITSDNTSIYKGYLYSNLYSSNKTDKKYNTIDKLKISNTDIINEFIVKEEVDKIASDSEERALDGISYYLKTEIDEKEFNELFGKTGYIEIYNGTTNVLMGVINQNSTKVNGKYVFEYGIDVSSVEFRIINPTKDGNIQIKNEKSIKAENGFTREDIIVFNKIKSILNMKTAMLNEDGEIILQENTSSSEIKLENTESKMTMSLNETKLSTDVENDVTFNVSLNTNSEMYEIFQNPTINIILPYAVESVNIKNINLLYKNGLSLSEWNVNKNELGNNVITIKLEGTQLEYMPGSSVEGTIISINAILKLDKLTANGKTNVQLEYTNEIGSRLSYEVSGKSSEEYEVEYVSREGILKETELSNYNESLESIYDFNDELNTGLLEVNTEEKVANMSMAILNNYDTEISDVYIIGRIPAIGNSEESGENLETTFDSNLTKEISLSGLLCGVSYSEDINAEKDDDSWVENPEDITKMKSYKIDIENETMKKGEKINFDYDFKIPGNLNYNEKAYGIYSVHYNLNGEEIVESSSVKMETEEKEIDVEELQAVDNVEEMGLAVGTQATLAGKIIDEDYVVHEGEIIKYKLIVKNNGQAPINNINLKATANNGNMFWLSQYEIEGSSSGVLEPTVEWVEDTDKSHTEEKFSIDTLAPGESRAFEYQIAVRNKFSEDNTVFGIIEIKADGYDSQEITTIKNKFKQAPVNLMVETAYREPVADEMYMEANSLYRLRSDITNTSGETLNDIAVSFKMPKFMTLNKELTEALYDETVEMVEGVNENYIITHVNSLQPEEVRSLRYCIEVGDINLQTVYKDISFIASAVIDGEEYFSNEYSRTVVQTATQFKVDYTANIENGSVVNDGDRITYRIDITNEGAIKSDFEFVDKIVEGYNLDGARLVYEDGRTQDIEYSDEMGYLPVEVTVNPKEKVAVEITGLVDIYDCTDRQEGINNSLEVYNEDIVNSNIEDKVFVVNYPDNYWDELLPYSESEAYSIPELTEEDLPQLPDLEEDEQEEIIEEDEVTDEIIGEEEETDEIIEEEELPEEELLEETSEEELPIEGTQEEQIPEETINQETVTPEDVIVDNPPVNTGNSLIVVEKDEYNPVVHVNDYLLDLEVEEDDKSPDILRRKIVDNSTEFVFDDNVISGTNKISGLVWYDDKDGLYNDENTARNVEVMLFKTQNKLNINEDDLFATTKTDINGKYEFTNLKEDTYVVVFNYNNDLYEGTTYNVNKVGAVNSAAVDKELIINGQDKKYGVSDLIRVSSEDENVNFGLANSKLFDIEAKTYIDSIIMTKDDESSTEYYGENIELNKFEISPDRIKDSVLTVTYKIKLTNTGNVAGYVNQIIDTVPNGFEFNKDINKNWKLSNDGSLYNSSLMNNEIKPDESVEISLVLTKKLDEDSTGNFENKVEVLNSTNSYGIKDENTDNNSSKVDLLITIETGRTIYVVVIIAITIIALAILTIFGKKFNLSAKYVYKVIILTIILSTLLVLNVGTSKIDNLKGNIMDNYITGSLNSFYKYNHALKTQVDNGSLGSNSLISRKSQCIEGSSLSGNISSTGKRHLLALADFNKEFENPIGYIHKKTNNKWTSEKSNKYSALLAYMGYACESAAYGTGGNVYHTYKNALVGLGRNDGTFRKNLPTVMGGYITAYNFGSSNYATSSIVSDSKAYMKYAASANNKLSKGAGYTGNSLTINKDGKIPLSIIYPNPTTKYGGVKTILQYYNGSWKNYKTMYQYKSKKVTKGKGKNKKTTTTYYYDKVSIKKGVPKGYSNKTVYVDNVANLTKVRATTKSYQYRGRAAFCAGGSSYVYDGQMQMVLRGSRKSVSSSVIWSLQNSYTVYLNNFVGIVGSANYGTGREGIPLGNRYGSAPTTETGDIVTFYVRLTNLGDEMDKFVLTDYYNAGQLDFIDWSSSISGFSVTDYDGRLVITFDGAIPKNNNRLVALSFRVIQPPASIYLATDCYVTNVYDDGANINGFLTANSVLRSYDYLRVLSAGVNVNKFIVSIADANNGNRVVASGRESNKGPALYADYGDLVTFGIRISNPGQSAIYRITLTDTYNASHMQFLGFSIADNSGFKTSGTAGSWVIQNVTSGSFKLYFTGGIGSGGNSGVVYLKFKLIKPIDGANDRITNSVTVGTVYNKNNIQIPGGQRSEDSFFDKKYDANVNKYITRVISTPGVQTYNRVSSKPENVFAETGDIIEFRIDLTNASANNAYGAIRGFKLVDTYTAKAGLVQFLGFSTNQNSGYTTSGTVGGWTIAATSAAGQYNITYNGQISAGTTATLYARIKVNGLTKTNEDVANKIQLNTGANRNNAALNFANKVSSDKAKIKKYSVDVYKYIAEINGTRVLPDRSRDKSQEVTIEYGDIVTYKIRVKNTGTNANLDGDLRNVIITDAYPNIVFEYVAGQNLGTGWSTSDKKNFSYANALVPNAETTLTIKLKVVGIDKTAENSKKIINEGELTRVVNKNNINILPGINGNTKDSDVATLLTYNLEVSKYMTKLKVSDSFANLANRADMTNEEKFNGPVLVEKGNEVIYTIRIKNTGDGAIHSMTMLDTLDSGLAFSNTTIESARLYSSDTDNTGTDIKTGLVIDNSTGSPLARRIKYNQVFTKEQRIVIEIRATVDKTNLYLLNLKNKFEIPNITNKNGYELNGTDFLEYDRYDNEDYVRLKDLIISGRVWIDANLDGVMDASESKLQGIKVTLYDVTNGKKAVVETDSTGKYSFNETNGEAARAGATNLNKKMVLSEGRVVKGTNRNETTGNYDTTSSHINYYIEFEYNGVMYEATPVYANDTHLEKADNKIKNEYKTDSNATEFNDLRENFNERLETISYDRAITKEMRENGTPPLDASGAVLAYDKAGHISTLRKEDNENSKMRAYSFINPSKPGLDGIQAGDIRYLWFKNNAGQYDGETEYLQYINFGLYVKTFDLEIEQDVYAVKNTINGQEMTYEFGQRGKLAEYGGNYITGGERPSGDYSNNNYNLKIYNSDYYYNSQAQYKNNAVKDYKKNTELNTEVTFKVKVTNKDTNDGKGVYTVIREIADYYSTNFMRYDSVTGRKTIKVTGSDGYLTEAYVDKIVAWYGNDDANNAASTKLTVSDSRKYGETKPFTNYNTLYITGFDNMKLQEGDSFEFYIKFVVDTKAVNNPQLKIDGGENNIVEINAYSTYKSNDRPAGYIDNDSNPGNLANVDGINLYEDDTFRTGIDLILEDNKNSERTISGVVWDDARSLTTPTTIKGTQYYGNGVNTTSSGTDKKAANAEENMNVKSSPLNIRTGETIDIPIKNLKASLVEIIEIKNPVDGKVHYYEETINPWLANGVIATTTDSGSYDLRSFIPGKYEVHFEYGYTAENNEMIVYNGQDYKSTLYNIALDTEYFATGVAQDAKDDAILNALRLPGSSDAKDDEIRRLEVISYSEKMNNGRSRILQNAVSGIRGTAADKNALVNNTAMLANTVGFKVRPEDMTSDEINSSNGIIAFATHRALAAAANRFRINNVDFGLEYRPEAMVSLEKYITNITVELSTGEKLLDIKYNLLYKDGDDGKTIIGTERDEKNSKGYDNLQYLPNRYDANRRVTAKGFAFVNMDMDLLQGTTVKIEYILVANNLSEIDRISTRLDALSYRQDSLAYESFMDENYTAAGTARNELYSKYYENDGTRIKERTMNTATSEGYYGRYLGNMYYTGTIVAGEDVVSKVKIDKILDYVDNDMVFSDNDNMKENQLWRTATAEDLDAQEYIDKNIIRTSGIVKRILDVKGISFTSNEGTDQATSNLAVSVDDRTSNLTSEGVVNKNLSKYISPEDFDEKLSFGTISIVAGKVVSTEEDTDNMKYDNIAEIIQYTTQTGRTTAANGNSRRLGATVGNANLVDETEIDEMDTSYTETVSLVPPTGLELSRYYISIYMNKLLVLLVSIATLIIGFIVAKKMKGYKVVYK